MKISSKNKFHMKIFFIFILTFIISFLLLSLYNERALTLWTEYSGEYELQINIISNETNEYIILIPCIVNSSDKIVPEFMDNLIPYGNGKNEIIYNEFGPMLEITAIGNYSLRSTYSFDTHNGDNVRNGFNYFFSTLHENETKYSHRNEFCYAKILTYSGSYLIIDFNLQISESGYFYNGLGQGGWNWGTDGHIRTNGTVMKNWTEIPFSQELDCADAFVGWDFFSDIGRFGAIGLSGLISLIPCLIFFIFKNNVIYNKIPYTVVFFMATIFFSFMIIEQITNINGMIFLGEPGIMNTNYIQSEDTNMLLLVVTVIILIVIIRLIISLIQGYGPYIKNIDRKYKNNDERSFLKESENIIARDGVWWQGELDGIKIANFVCIDSIVYYLNLINKLKEDRSYLNIEVKKAQLEYKTSISYLKNNNDYDVPDPYLAKVHLSLHYKQKTSLLRKLEFYHYREVILTKDNRVVDVQGDGKFVNVRT